jgi:nitroreductase
MTSGTTEGTNDLWEAMYTQRAIRYFKPDPVPAELITKCIEAATRAPSGTNLQPWGFVVIQDPAMRKRIADKLRATFEANEGLKTMVESGAKSPVKTQRLMMSGVTNVFTRLDSAPVFIVPCLHNVMSPAREGLLAGSSIYQAVQNLMLAARGLGLGTVMTTFQNVVGPELNEWLGLPENTVPVALIPLGWPAVKFGPLNRKPVEEVTFWETWGNTKAPSA